MFPHPQIFLNPDPLIVLQILLLTLVLIPPRLLLNLHAVSRNPNLPRKLTRDPLLDAPVGFTYVPSLQIQACWGEESGLGFCPPPLSRHRADAKTRTNTHTHTHKIRGMFELPFPLIVVEIVAVAVVVVVVIVVAFVVIVSVVLSLCGRNGIVVVSFNVAIVYKSLLSRCWAS